ncbi:MAG: hypothetical protein JO276_00085 [Sphingomonadaceae bacterium]|nr:hypothetical protein [Sphingomonadaceae bacterium]
MRRLLFLLLFLAPAPALAQSGAADDRCGGRDAAACRGIRAALDRFGLPTAESRAAAGEEIRRALFTGPWGNPIVAVEYRRAPDHDPSVAIYGDRAARAGEDGIVAASVPLAEWERLGAAGRFFDRALAPDPAEAGGPILVCADGEGILVETTDPAAWAPAQRLRRHLGGSCPEDLASTYAYALADAAVRLLPGCAGLAPRGPGNAPTLLRDCLTLAGDRMAAAEVHNRLADLRRAAEQDRPADLFARDLVVDWNGTPIPARQASVAWLYHFYPRRLFGETGHRVRVEGALARVTSGAGGREVHWEAPVTLTFVYQPAQTWQIASIRVGAFATVDRTPAPRPAAASR